jgi:hypothetical protein
MLYGLGVLAAMVPFLYYAYSSFGRFAIPYELHLNPQFRLYMSRGFMGATSPSATVLWLISFHPFRGIFVYSPQLFLGLLGLLYSLKDNARRPLAILCTAAVIFYFLFSSAYYMWWGGWSFAPRHLAPAVPFLAAGLLPWLRRAWSRMLLIITSLAGVIVHTIVNATEPQPPDGGWQAALLHPSLSRYDYPAVFLQDTLPRLFHGGLDKNLASFIGMNDPTGLTPLIVFWDMMAVLIFKTAPSNIPHPTT